MFGLDISPRVDEINNGTVVESNGDVIEIGRFVGVNVKGAWINGKVINNIDDTGLTEGLLDLIEALLHCYQA